MVQRKAVQAALLLLCSLALPLGCQCGPGPDGGEDAGEDGGQGETDGGLDDGGPSDGGPRGDGGPTDGGPRGPDGGEGLAGTREQFCSGTGTAARVGDSRADGGANLCTGDLAERSFRFALCACERTALGALFSTSGYDATKGPPDGGSFGGSVGINGPFCSTGATVIRGQMYVGGRGPDGGSVLCEGANAFRTSDVQNVHGELHVNGNFLNSAVATVRRDAYIRGNVAAQDALTISGRLYQPAGATRSGSLTTGGLITQPVTVAPPCNCDPATLLDVPGIVAWGRANNDNRDVTVVDGGAPTDGGFVIDPGMLAGNATDRTVNLPCGRYYFTSIGVTGGTLRLRLSGRTALFVDGDISVSGGGLIIELGPEGEVDTFVRGNFTVSNNVQYGRIDKPAGARLYVGGTTVRFEATSTFVGNLYAPKARVEVTDRITVYGSIFAREYHDSASGSIIHFDQSISRAADSCQVDGGTADAGPRACTTCLDCRSSQACVNNECGSCRNNSDCCAPLVCDTGSGQCIPGLN